VKLDPSRGRHLHRTAVFFRIFPYTSEVEASSNGRLFAAATDSTIFAARHVGHDRVYRPLNDQLNADRPRRGETRNRSLRSDSRPVSRSSTLPRTIRKLACGNQMLDIRLGASGQVVEHGDALALRQKVLREVRANEARASCNQVMSGACAGHRLVPSPLYRAEPWSLPGVRQPRISICAPNRLMRSQAHNSRIASSVFTSRLPAEISFSLAKLSASVCRASPMRGGRLITGPPISCAIRLILML